MNTIYSTRIFSLVTILNCFIGLSVGLTESECHEKQYKQCIYDSTTKYTAHQIATAQRYIQQRFAVTNPERAACPISVDNPPCIRKEVKCLTDEELSNLTSAWRQLYANGVIDRYTKIHSDYWGATHKHSEAIQWHFYLINQIEKELQKINPKVCMPYWNFLIDYANPEKSKVFDMFGHAGDESNDYCVPDGPFAQKQFNVTVNFPQTHCLKRQWRLNTKVDPWKNLEWLTAVQQMPYNTELVDSMFKTIQNQMTLEMMKSMSSLTKYDTIELNPHLTPYIQRVIFIALINHFDVHLSIGGWNGDMSVPYAPNDILFHLFHIAGDLVELVWQLSNDKDYYLLPKSYNMGIRYDNQTHTRWFSDIDTDKFAYFQTPVKESFQFGYGDNCYLYDVTILPINQLVQLNQAYQYYYKLNVNQTCIPLLTADKIATLPSYESLSFPSVILFPCTLLPLPAAAQRLKDALPKDVLTKYFPAFAHNNWTLFDIALLSLLPAVDSCNAGNSTTVCKPMPLAMRYNATREGQRQYDMFTSSVANFDYTHIVDEGTSIYEKFMNDLNQHHYCSPFV